MHNVTKINKTKKPTTFNSELQHDRALSNKALKQQRKKARFNKSLAYSLAI